jgi:hypothetical protein
MSKVTPAARRLVELPRRFAFAHPNWTERACSIACSLAAE